MNKRHRCLLVYCNDSSDVTHIACEYHFLVKYMFEIWKSDVVICSAMSQGLCTKELAKGS